VSAVTLDAKCYVFVCAGCNLLAQSDRSDALTCSPACRVRAHRNGELKRLRSSATALDIRPALIQRAKAVTRLQPDLEGRIRAGELSLDDVRPQMARAFGELLARFL